MALLLLLLLVVLLLWLCAGNVASENGMMSST
jgi:hypothetical protein